ncbi:NAD-dependent epimerase/dehydratase family protein [Lysobacter korlensis]|uniref:NAD-dependent epimerase/dehydratase family protein n=1 Tax=Lysobacter korlensis TaxID=553636 RepID=A0ABV6S1M3_9GAMM
MKVMITGGSGYIGSAVLSRLVEHGHQVQAVVRSARSAEAVTRKGGTALLHDVTDVEWMTGRLRQTDAFVHTASPQDSGSAQFDDAILDAVTAAYAGTEKPYLHTGGVWVWGDSQHITEASERRPARLVAWRPEREARVLTSGLRASVIAPAVVYGNGGGLTNLIVQRPTATDGVALLLGNGEQHWTTVHVDDLADLYTLALDRAPGGETYIGASGENPTVREIAEAAFAPGTPLRGEGAAATRLWLGADFADALLLDQQATGARARSALGWSPTRPSLIAQLTADRAPAHA